MRGAAADDLARRPECIGWKVAATVLAPDGPHEIATGAEGAARRVEIDGKAASQTALGAVLRVLWLTPAMDRIWIEGAAERRRFLDRLTLSLVPEHGEVAIAYDRALRERNRLLRDGVRDPGWFAAVEDAMATAGARLAAHRAEALARLAATGADTAFPRAELSIVGEAPRNAPGLRDALREGRQRDAAAGRTLVGPHRDDLRALYAAKGIEARLCSTGEQKALLVSLVLANARAVAAAFGRAPVLLLDEITAHLDDARRANLFRALETVGSQAFMTGTGPELFEGIDAQRFAVAEAGGASTISPVA